MNRSQLITFSEEVRKFMDRYGVGPTIACCYLNTYPDDTHYCSGHGLYGDNRDCKDCKFKECCKDIATKDVRNKSGSVLGEYTRTLDAFRSMLR